MRSFLYNLFAISISFLFICRLLRLVCYSRLFLVRYSRLVPVCYSRLKMSKGIDLIDSSKLISIRNDRGLIPMSLQCQASRPWHYSFLSEAASDDEIFSSIGQTGFVLFFEWNLRIFFLALTKSVHGCHAGFAFQESQPTYVALYWVSNFRVSRQSTIFRTSYTSWESVSGWLLWMFPPELSISIIVFIIWREMNSTASD